MHPLLELQKILQDQSLKRASGRVVRVGATGLDIVINGRVRHLLRRGDATAYKVGDRVSVQGDVLLGRIGTGAPSRIVNI